MRTYDVRRSLRPAELEAKFTLVTVVSQRTKQLQAGARPRLYAPGHSLLRVAMQETLDGLVSFELGPPPEVPAA